MSALPAVCGICKRPPRQGEDGHRIRLEAEDMIDAKYPEPKKVGLYQCCQECHDLFKPRIAARLGKTVEQLGGYDLM